MYVGGESGYPEYTPRKKSIIPYWIETNRHRNLILFLFWLVISIIVVIWIGAILYVFFWK